MRGNRLIKKKLSLNVLFALFILGAVSCTNRTDETFFAQKIFMDHLQNISDFIKDENLDSSGRRIKSVFFLEQVTGIYSESKISTFGKMNPTADDLEKWTNWYNDNKDDMRLSSDTFFIINDTFRVQID